VSDTKTYAQHDQLLQPSDTRSATEQAPTIQAPDEHYIDHASPRCFDQLLAHSPLQCAASNLFHLGCNRPTPFAR